ncbi:MAG: hypothetical protein JST48_09965 [Bacteroidetes bacterium]|nr:hypothetical protein [Bacteroidota bacterium]
MLTSPSLATVKSLSQHLFILCSITIFSTSCGTIVGGSKYYAHVLVNGHPKAEIVYQGVSRGNGNASMLVNRNQANNFLIVVKEKGCDEQTFSYTSRTFRGWALVGSLLFWSANIDGFPIPYGLAVDLIDGSLWKPNVSENGVEKSNYKNFQYTLNYNGCDSKIQETTPLRQDKLVDVVYLKNGSIIRGTLMEQDPITHVKIQTQDGSIFVFKIDEILKVTRE